MDHLSKPIFTIGKYINIPPCSFLNQVCRAWSFLRGMGFTCETADVLEGLTLVGLPAIHYLKLLGHEMSWICKHQYMRNWEVNRDVIGNFWVWNGGLVLWGTTLCMKQTARNYVTFRISKLHITAPYPTEDSWSKQGNPRNYQQGRSWSSFLRYAPRTLQTLVLNDNEPLQEVVPNHQVGGCWWNTRSAWAFHS